MELSRSPSWLKQPVEDSGEKSCDQSQEEILFTEVTRPIIFTMKLLGMWHERSPTGATVQPSDQSMDNTGHQVATTGPSFWNVIDRLAIFYHAFINIILWFDFVRFFIGLVSKATYNNASFLFWFLQTAATNTVLFIACYRCCKVERFYLFWQNLLDENHRGDSNQMQTYRLCSKPKSLRRKKFRRIGIMATLGGWLFVLFTFPLDMYFTFNDNYGYRFLCLPWTGDIPCGLFQIIHFYELACHKFPIVYLCLICYILSERFEALTKSFENENPIGTSASSESLEAARRQHNILCLLTHQLDYIFSALIAIVFATNIPLLILLMYDLYLHISTIDGFILASTIYWTLSNILNIFLISWFCSMLHERAHSLRRHVFELHVESSDTKTSHIHMLLVSRLNGPNIGLSFLGFFTITRNVILTIAGFTLTYFTLLIDLTPDKSDIGTCFNVTSDVTL